MAFRNKAQVILSHKPDILVVPECEHPDKLVFKAGAQMPKNVLWFGNNKNKGLAVFSYSEFKLRVLNVHNKDLRMIVPIQVKGSGFDFILFAVWAYNPNDLEGRYIEQVRKAVDCYGDLMRSNQSMIIGDFNSNTIWDKKHRASNHSAVVELLEEKGILSLYHLHYKQVQGKELHPTYYMYRHKTRPYHIDYCFASSDFISRLKSVDIGDFDFWKTYSDHVPLIVEFASAG
jgi:exodeoxyribonuclease III